MQSTSVDQLVSNGFTEDRGGARALQMSFALPLALGTGGFLLALALLLLKRIHVGWGMALAVGTWCFIALTLWWMYRSAPKSRHTGRPLLKYKNQFPDAGVMVELLYVCPESKTFFRRVYAMKSHGGDGG